MRLALDTNAYSDLGRGKPRMVELIHLADEVLLPFVVLAELRAGFALGTIAKQNQVKLEKFLAQSSVSVLYPDEGTVYQYAQLFRQLRLGGTPIPTNDLWIAALVTQYGCSLATRDKHFEALPQLMVVT